MNIAKAIGIFILTSVLLFLLSNFLPKVGDVTREQVGALVKIIKYSPESIDDINKVIDKIDADIAISHNNKVVTSNLSKDSQEKRVSLGEKLLPSLTKSVQSGELTLNFTEHQTTKYILLSLLPLFAGLITGGVFFFMDMRMEEVYEKIGEEKMSNERLMSQLDLLERKDLEVSNSVPENPEEMKNLFKNMIREKEFLLKDVNKLKEREDELAGDINNLKGLLKKSKETINDLEKRNNDFENKLAKAESTSKVGALEKVIEELKVKLETSSTELKESKVKIKEHDKDKVALSANEDIKKELAEAEVQIKTLKSDLKALNKADVEAIKSENNDLKKTLSDSEAKVKALKEDLKALNKADMVSLQSQNNELKEEIKTLNERLKDSSEKIGSLGKVDAEKEKAEKEDLKRELKETKLQLKEALEDLTATDIGQLRKDNIELERNYNKAKQELKVAKETVEKFDQVETEKLLSDNRKKEDEIKKLKTQLDDALKTLKELDKVKVDSLLAQMKEKDKDLEDTKLQLKLSQDMVSGLKAGKDGSELGSSLEEKQLLGSLQGQNNIMRQKMQQLEEELRKEKLKEKAGGAVGKGPGTGTGFSGGGSEESVEMKHRLDELKEIQKKLEEEKEELEVELKTKQDLLDNIPSGKRQLVEMSEIITREKNQLESKLRTLEKTMKKKDDEVNSMKLELTDRSSELKKAYNDLADATNKRPSDDGDSTELKNELFAAKSKIAELQRSIARAAGPGAEKGSADKNLQDLIDTLRDENNFKDSEIKKLNNEMKKVRAELLGSQTKTSSSVSQADTERLVKNIDELQGENERRISQVKILEDELQKAKNIALKYRKERDDKIKNMSTLKSMIDSSTESLKKRDEELAAIDEKYKSKISEIKAQTNAKAEELVAMNNKYRDKIDEMRLLSQKQNEELEVLKKQGEELEVLKGKLEELKTIEEKDHKIEELKEHNEKLNYSLRERIQGYNKLKQKNLELQKQYEELKAAINSEPESEIDPPSESES